MRIRLPRGVSLAALLLGGCQGFVASNALVEPGFQQVRVSFAAPRAVVVARRDGAGTRADTLRGVTALYGRVVAVRRDTVRMVVTQVGRSGVLQYLPSRPDATVDIAAGTSLDRWGYSRQRTAGLGIAMSVLVVAVGLWLESIAAGLD